MKIQDKLKQMGEYACLALCYLEMVNIIDDRKPFFILMGMKEGFLDDECTVKNPEGFLELPDMYGSVALVRNRSKS